MDKRYINRFGDFYRHRASLVWYMGSLAYCFEKKDELHRVPQLLWSLREYVISQCIIDLYRFNFSMDERIDFLNRKYSHEWFIVNELVQEEPECKGKVHSLYGYLEELASFTYEIEDEHGILYKDRLSAEEQVEFENTFWKKATPKFKKAHKAYRDLLAIMDDRVYKIRKSLVKDKVPISLPHTPESAMLPEEKAFYHQAKAIWDKEEYIDIEENVNYLWVYVQELLAKRQSVTFESLKGILVRLCERYYTEETFFISCGPYIEDLALERGDVKCYLDWSEMQRVYGHCSLESESRVGVAMRENIPLHPMDIIMATGGYYSKFIRDNYALYKFCLYQKFSEYDNAKGWYNLLKKLPTAGHINAVQCYLGLPGVVCESKVYNLFDASAEPVCKTIVSVCQDAEKMAIEMKSNGDSWEIERHERIFEYLKGYLPQLKMFLEARPLFANGEVIPIYIPYRDIAICRAGVESKCDAAEIQRRNIRFVNIDSEPNQVVEEIKSLL